MTSKIHNDSHAIYGVGKLAQLYREFTRESVFSKEQRYCLKPSMGGSFFGNIRKETRLDKKSFRIISSLVCDSEAEIKGILPVGKLYYFKAKNQEYYKTRASQYFNLVKRHLFTLDKKCKNDVLWCFFPMYHTEHDHLVLGELSAFILWFEKPSKQKAKLYHIGA